VKQRGDKTLVYERKPVDKLTENDLLRIKDADRNHKLVSALRAWFEDGRPKDKPPTWKYRNGDGFSEEPIRKVRLVAKDQPAILLNGGTVDRGDMARVDVFRNANRKGKWEFYVVPIYPHQIAGMDTPPNSAVKGGGVPETEWPEMDESAEFLWSIHPMSYLEIIKSNGERIEGYFRSLDRNTGAITVSPHMTAAQIRKGIGVKTLASFRKFTVDRLGRRFEVLREVRTWRGRACT
jgi:CRISPR-associated endonuclease Csn1